MRCLLARSHAGTLRRSCELRLLEVIGVLSVLASPHWQSMAGSGDASNGLIVAGMTSGRRETSMITSIGDVLQRLLRPQRCSSGPTATSPGLPDPARPTRLPG